MRKKRSRLLATFFLRVSKTNDSFCFIADYFVSGKTSQETHDDEEEEEEDDNNSSNDETSDSDEPMQVSILTQSSL